MPRSSDIRDWLREQGRDVPPNGRLKAADIAAYEAAQAAGAEDISYPGDPGPDGPVSDSAGTAEQAPRTARPKSAGPGAPWFRRGQQAKKGKAPRERRRFPRVPVNRLIEHAWADVAWAASGMPPMARLLTAQAPLAGMVFEDVIKGTAADAILQPAARFEDKADKVYGMLAPPLNVLAVMATAPAPGEAPSVAHKAAFLGLRHSLLIMARVGGPNLEEIEERAEDNRKRTADVDRFIAYLFDMPRPDESEDEAVIEGQVLFASAAAESPA